MMEPKPVNTANKALIVCHIIWATLLVLPMIVVLLFSEQMIDSLFDWLLFDLPNVDDVFTALEWVFLGAINVLIFLAVMSVLLVFRVVAIPVMVLTCLPSVVGAVAVLMNKKWGMKSLLVSGIFSLVLIPFGTVLGVWTIMWYRKMNKEMVPKPVEESQAV